ncbi:glycosyltransferase [Streptosporangium carneum]|uniref:Glycosyl transferase family 1 n=1 Tax=Streptosporangium carneum TaxID=47481 RepID=A0A9W6I953_9ACTN|nr:glycosyltransferase [Streptosporangium carneum]GLK14355.1 glycosyl transferase family 1 [Streptosporangium carneum]
MTRILVGLHHLELGGSQLNALDLATSVRDLGHDVHVFATHTAKPGPVADLVRDRGLPLTLIRHRLVRTRRAMPCRPAVAREIGRLAREKGAELVHSYEYPLILDAFYGTRLPLVGTVYAMGVPSWIPRHVPVVAGTAAIADEARARGQWAELIEPPVNTDLDAPGAVDGAAFRAEYGIAPREVAVVVVSRLEPDMKAEGVERAMDALRVLGQRVRLVVVGDGPSYEALARRGARVNAELGRHAVVMTGALADPRPAYAAADVTLGMGGSALRAMSFAKPLIVLGVRGFAKPMNPGTWDYFQTHGFFGSGLAPGEPDLTAHLAELVAAPKRWAELGAWSRDLVVGRYGLAAAAATLDDVYRRALAAPAGAWLPVAARTAAHRAAAEVAPVGLRARIRPLLGPSSGGARA